MSHSLSFREDGTFVIVQFTDIHWENGGEADQKSQRLMESVIDAEQPDLVVLTGDMIESTVCTKPDQSFRQLTSFLDKKQVGWCAVFGNHDSEIGITREQLMEIQMESEYCLSQYGPEDIHGVGNYVLTVTDQNERNAAALYFLDSGSYAPASIGGYEWVHHDQVEWYRRESKALTEHGASLPALAFFHIPLPEYNEVWDTRICYGSKYESVCSPLVNSGLFTAFMEMGDVMGTFVGHDHINDFWGELHGIRLCYGRKTGYCNYGKENFLKGARIIRLNKGQKDFDTWLRLEDGSTVIAQEEHYP